MEPLAKVQAREYFSEETHWEKAAKTRMGKYLTQVETDFISRSVNLTRENLVIMDIGAEAGRFSLLAANQNSTVISIDVDSYSLKRLKSKDHQVNVIQADARKLPLKNEVFDVIFLIEVLDYIPELEQAFAESNRALKPNASCILSFGNKSSLKSKMREMRGKSYQHSYRKVMRSLSETGFIIERKMGYSWLPFGRTSGSKLVPVLARIESVFGLRGAPRFSPWVITHVIKPARA